MGFEELTGVASWQLALAFFALSVFLSVVLTWPVAEWGEAAGVTCDLKTGARRAQRRQQSISQATD